jgi:hypothetical protein
MTHDAFSRHDAAYVLGALSPADRRAFEDHLRECEGCRQAVADVAGLPGLLAKVDPAEIDPDHPGGQSGQVDPVPETLLPRLLREVQRARRRRRGWAAASAAAAAVAVVGVGVALGPGGGSPDRPPPPAAAPARTMGQVGQTGLSASVAMEEVAWGTRLTLTCTYEAQGYDDDGARPAYALVVRTRDGVEQVATWRAVAGRAATVVAATASPRSEITSLEVRTTGGEPVLRLAG